MYLADEAEMWLILPMLFDLNFYYNEQLNIHKGILWALNYPNGDEQ